MKNKVIRCLFLSIAVSVAAMACSVRLDAIDAKPNENRSIILIGDAKMMSEYEAVLTERGANIKRWIGIVETSKDKEFNGSKHIAIKLLGGTKAEEGIDVLSRNMLFIPSGLVADNVIFTQAYYASVVALVQIGSPAVDPMVDKIRRSSSQEERHLAAWVVMEVEGKEQALFRLKNVLSKTINTAESKVRLQEAILYLKDFKATAYPPGFSSWEDVFGSKSK